MHAGYLAKWFWSLDFNAFSLRPYPFRVTEVFICYPLVQLLRQSSVNTPNCLPPSSWNFLTFHLNYLFYVPKKPFYV